MSFYTSADENTHCGSCGMYMGEHKPYCKHSQPDPEPTTQEQIEYTEGLIRRNEEKLAKLKKEVAEESDHE